MKKIIIAILTISSILTILCSCGAKADCDFCGDEYCESKGQTKEIFGDTVHICPECYTELETLLK